MEDRYLFKAKRLDWRKFPEKEWWITGYYVLGFDEYKQPVHLIFETITMYSSHADTETWTEIEKNTLCQCTGLKDKNGKLIWENDIVSYRDCTEEWYVTAWESNKACFEHQQYSCSIMNFDELGGCEVEVIGNIFDNPELLESEEN